MPSIVALDVYDCFLFSFNVMYAKRKLFVSISYAFDWSIMFIQNKTILIS